MEKLLELMRLLQTWLRVGIEVGWRPEEDCWSSSWVWQYR